MRQNFIAVIPAAPSLDLSACHLNSDHRWKFCSARYLFPISLPDLSFPDMRPDNSQLVTTISSKTL
jgi:hypothetical protein